MTKEETKLIIRSCYGRWRVSGEVYILKANPQAEKFDLRQHIIKHIRGYKPVIETHTDDNQMLATISAIKTMNGIHEWIEHPELQEFFRNGEPITSGVIFTDFIKNYEPVSEPQTFEKSDFDFSALYEAFD